MSFGPPLSIKPRPANAGTPSSAMATQRAFEGLMQMGKIDIAAIEAARRG